jgi:23S rRNA pseudouridine1911/1915/1917 synthase
MKPEPIRILVGEEHSAERLDLFLAGRFPEFSRSKLQKAIIAGAVLLNGEVTAKKSLVSLGDIVLVDTQRFIDRPFDGLVPQDIPLSILYEDEYCIAIDKPAGMVVHPGNGNRECTLVHALLYYAGESLSHGSDPDRPGIVHRLDKNTSGVILVAKNDEAHRRFAALFSRREIHKQYIGICCGAIPKEHGVIGAKLGRSRTDPIKRSVREDGKEAVTEYRLIGHQCGISVVNFSPKTGRTHQIRVHASLGGFPVVRDDLYGGGKDALERLPVLDRTFAQSVYKCFIRHALHAFRLEFVHPFTEKRIALTAPLPQDFTQAMSLFNEKIDTPELGPF